MGIRRYLAFLIFTASVLCLAASAAPVQNSTVSGGSLTITAQSTTAIIGYSDSVTGFSSTGGSLQLLLDGQVIMSGPSPLAFNLAELNQTGISPGTYLMTVVDTSSQISKSIKITLLAKNSTLNNSILNSPEYTALINQPQNQTPGAESYTPTAQSAKGISPSVIIAALAAIAVAFTYGSYRRNAK